MTNKHDAFPSHTLGNKDVEPITLALLIFAGISAIGSLVGIGREVWETRQRREAIRRQAERHLFEARRQLHRLKASLDEFSSYIEEYGLIDKRLGIGQAPIVEDEITTRRLRRLRREITAAGDRFAVELEELTALLGDSERVDRVQSLVLELSEDFDGIRRVEKYGDYLGLTTYLVDKVRQVLRNVASLYDIRLPE